MKTFAGHIEHLTLVLEQLEILGDDAQKGLIAAEEREARQRVVVQQQVAQAKKTVDTYIKLRAAYPQHAEAIATIVAAEAAAEAAHRVLRDAGLAPKPFPVGPGGKALRVTVNLPGHVSPPVQRPTAMDAYAR